MDEALIKSTLLHLSVQQAQILYLTCSGLSRVEIAERLIWSESSIYQELKRIESNFKFVKLRLFDGRNVDQEVCRVLFRIVNGEPDSNNWPPEDPPPFRPGVEGDDSMTPERRQRIVPIGIGVVFILLMIIGAVVIAFDLVDLNGIGGPDPTAEHQTRVAFYAQALTVRFYDDFEDGLDPGWVVIQGEPQITDGVLASAVPENNLTLAVRDNDLEKFAIEIVNGKEGGFAPYLQSEYESYPLKILIGSTYLSFANDFNFLFPYEEYVEDSGSESVTRITVELGEIGQAHAIRFEFRDERMFIYLDGDLLNNGEVPSEHINGDIFIEITDQITLDSFLLEELP